MEPINLQISGLHAAAFCQHILIVLKNQVEGKKPGEITSEEMSFLEALDATYLKLRSLTETDDDETPQSIEFTLSEAETLLRCFTDNTYTTLAEIDVFYEKRSYQEYFNQIYSAYLTIISDIYVEEKMKMAG